MDTNNGISSDKVKINFNNNEILFLLGENGTVGIVKSGRFKTLFIGTPELEEIAVFLEEDDLIAISAFGTGIKFEKGIKAMTYIIREMESPIITLAKNHPSSKRLKTVLSIGDSVCLDCNIIPGTHPEQDILCSCDSLSGIKINKTINGVELSRNTDYKIENL
ncbi:MAG: hypothetical protein ACRCVG_05350 [Methanobacteriaceae archaeon]